MLNKTLKMHFIASTLLLVPKESNNPEPVPGHNNLPLILRNSWLLSRRFSSVTWCELKNKRNI